MIEINPQLQSKIFDSLLLHMKAERKSPVMDAPAAPKGRALRSKSVSGRASSGKAALGKPIAGKTSPKADSVKDTTAKGPALSRAFASPQWNSLAADLHRLGLNKTTADALISWATSQAEQSRQSPVKIRVLHPMEREFISVEAYDYLLELYRLGLIGPPQLENLIENCAFLTSLPATREQIGKMALRAFTENLEVQGLGSSH